MDYEKKYKEAMRTLDSYTKDECGCARVRPENIFPELRESEDERIRKAIRIYLDWLDGQNKDYHPKGDCSIKDMLAWLEKQKQCEQPQQEWSEEDSKRLTRIHQFIWANRKGDTDEIYQQEQDADWLMTLKPQPKQEWDAQDEAFLGDAIYAAKNTYSEKCGQEELIDWLKSFKPSCWKPSKEQMEALNAINTIGELSYVGQGGLLVKLYQDLKKL